MRASKLSLIYRGFACGATSVTGGSSLFEVENARFFYPLRLQINYWGCLMLVISRFWRLAIFGRVN